MDLITGAFLPAALAFIMFSMGLSLVWADFRRVATEPKAFLVGAACQVILLPAIALLLVLGWSAGFGPSPEMAVGFMILAACPGGVTSNLLTHLARGDTALSISLTAVISVVSVLTIPFVVNGAIDVFLGAEAPHLPLAQTVAGIFVMTTVPVALGMLLKHLRPDVADRIEPASRHAATALFVLVVLGAVAKEWALLRDNLGEVGGAVLALNVLAMAMGYAVAGAARLDRRQRVAISLETGLQNGTMAIFIAATLLGSQTMMIPGAVYGLLMFATAGAFVGLVTRRGAGPAPQSAL